MTSRINPSPARRGSRVREDDALPEGAQPLHARLRDRLRTEILDGRLRPHDQLPSESELTERYAVSRITVRQALAALHAEGLIVKVQGKGSFVSQPRVSQELSRLRGLGESLAGEGHEVHARVLKLEDVPAPAAAAARLRVEPGSTVTELLSLRYVDREPLSLNRLYIAADIGAKVRRAGVAHRDILSIYETDLQLTIGRAEVMISAAVADKQQRKYLGLAEHAPVLQVDRVVYSADDRPLHVETSCYRSDAFSYRLTLER